MSRMTRHQRGAVSIFVVIFTALLVTVATVSFVRLMMRDQMRATNSDLSQSAYDAALAGVEDAKRAFTYYHQSGAPTSTDFSNCNTVPTLLGITPMQDVGVRVGPSNLNQAYTCVTIDPTPIDYVKRAGADETHLVPLRSAGGATFNRVTIEWFNDVDASGSTISIANTAGNMSSDWPQNKPSLLEVQLIQTRAGQFTVDQFDNGTSSQSNTNTLLLYPMNTATPMGYSFSVNNPRRSSVNDLSRVQCVADLAAAGRQYACRVEVMLPSPVTGSASSRANTYLRITPRYNQTEYRITMARTGSSVPVYFSNAQALVDSTGRADDLFRRVQARIEVSDRAPYPSAAVETNGNLCKTFMVTTRSGDYIPGTCTP